MAQKTNLNVSPYYDDFNSEKNFYKVLYKPGFPVQARELTTTQSILQNQLSSFGNNIFKDGSVVIPGAIAFDNQFQAVKLNAENYGTDISLYIKNFIGKKIRGQDSTIEAVVKYVSFPDKVNVTDTTIYVTYVSGDTNGEIRPFYDGELLTCNENVIYGNTTISAETPFASLISSEATAIGSAAFITKGVYYVRGYFVNVTDQTVILEHYKNNSSYKVGLKIDEILVNAKDDDTLYDNAKGYTNYAAPGADRLKINLTLTKRLLTDQNDADFIELMRVDKGKVKVLNSKSQYNIIRDWIAERTYDESGDYSLTPFLPSIHNSLNDNIGNNGLFLSNEKTEENNTPSDDLMCIKVSPGKAYVKGYDINKVGTTIIDVDKPRDIGVRTDTGVSFEMGSLLKVNRVSGVARQGYNVDLYNNTNSQGKIIGNARVYGLSLDNNSYVGDSSKWNLRLFDIQTNTSLTLNETVDASDIPQGSYIKGKKTGANGYAIVDGSGVGIVTVNQTSGSFAKGEPIQVNGIDFPRTITEVEAYNTQQIKSVRQSATSGYPEFKADTFLERFRLPNNITTVNIDPATIVGGAATCYVTTPDSRPFTGLRVGSIIRYSRSGFATETYNKVSSIGVGGTNIGITSMSNTDGSTDFILGLFDGEVPDNFNGNVNMFAGGPLVQGDGPLYAPIPNANVSSIDLSSSEIKITKQLTSEATDADGILGASISDVTGLYPEVLDATFESFDEERYSVHYSGGGVGSVNEGGFNFIGNDLKQISIRGLSQSETNTVLNTTINKRGIKSKLKSYNRSKEIDIVYSKYPSSGDVAVGLGASTIPDGLIYKKYYGIRVQDEEICLNYADVSKVLAVYESFDSNEPSLDVLVFSSTSDVQTNAVIGENITNLENTVVARVVGKPTFNQLSVIYLTRDRFVAEENVIFDESNITTKISSLIPGRYKDVTTNYTLDKGQRDQFYDYSRIIRSSNAKEPSRRLKIIIDYYSVSNQNEGDLFTVLSYDKERFLTDIPNIGKTAIRASDTLDFRPLVSEFTPSSATKSPFSFESRNFANSITQYLTPDESSRLTYEFYLPRIDKLYLDRFGEFIYEKGVSSINPKPPSRNDNLMELATFKYPPYLYNPQDAFMSLVDNRRYTMRDIGYIDDRVSNLEEVTSLSLLEVNTQTLQIQDSEGRNRFKSGFFVDPFRNYGLLNKSASSVEVNPFAQEITPSRTRNTLDLQITPASNLVSSDIDFNENFELFDSNVQKTGNVVTLSYDPVEWISQIYATEEINVNPYELPTYTGSMTLNPEMDSWTRTIRLEDQTVRQAGTDTIQNIQLDLSANGNLDLGSLTTNSESSSTRRIRGGGRDGEILDQTTEIEPLASTSGSMTLSGSTSDSVTLSNTDTTIQNRMVSSTNDDFMRSRNTEFKTTGFSDYTRFYLFVDGQKVDFIPKLLEITTESGGTNYGSIGSFKIGEEVHAIDPNNEEIIMKFRVCTPNHKFGAYNNPTETYLFDPYSQGNNEVPDNYSQSSRVLNVDTRALSEEAQGKYFGYVVQNSRLIGQESGAQAYVKDLRLLSDGFGDVIGSFFLRDPYTVPTPSVRINAGSKTVKLTSSPNNDGKIPGETADVQFAETGYTATGTVTEWENTITHTTNTNTLNIGAGFEATVNASVKLENAHTHTVVADYFDPVAQTFVVGGNIGDTTAVSGNDDLYGAFITAVEVFFHSIDTVTETPIECQIRTVTGDARPSREIKASVAIRPTRNVNGEIVENIQYDSESASVGTIFTFPEPVYVEPGKSYAIVLMAEKSVNYKVWTAVQGQNAKNIDTIRNNDGSSLQYKRQYGSGALFKSQNGALWTEDQTQDLTFRLYKAKFNSTSGSAFFNNPDLDESNYSSGIVLNNNPIKTLPKKGFIGINTSSTNISVLKPGRKICSSSRSSSTAVVTGLGCNAKSFNIVDEGTNYVTSAEVDTFTITGQGRGLKLKITAVNGALTVVEVDSSSNQYAGIGYTVGDTVGIVTSTITNSPAATGAIISISDIAATSSTFDSLFLKDIQGDANSFAIGAGLSFFDDNNTVTSLTAGGAINTLDFDSGVNAGNYMKVDHYSHGMYSDTNKVSIKNIESDVPSTILTANLTREELQTISIASTSQFNSFEGLDIGSIAGTANTGYLKIGNEIIGYKAVIDGALTIADAPDARGIDGSTPLSHPIGTKVSKYEFGGVSMRRIEASSQDVSNLNNDLDEYYVAFDRSKNGVNRSVDVDFFPQLSFKNDDVVGGSNVHASTNILYDSIVPRFDIFTPSGVDRRVTNITATMRSVSGTSVGGNEISFIDKGYEPIQLNRLNSFEDVRIIASKENENEYLNDIPRNKSLTTILSLTTNDENISPVIYLSNGSKAEFISHRLNNPIGSENYPNDSRVDSIIDDPHTAVYVSNTVRLTKPASSLKVILSAYKHSSADFRVLYSLIKSESDSSLPTFDLFPGYKNLTNIGFDDNVVNDSTKNDGRSDNLVADSLNNEYREYQYTVDNLDLFTGYTIKIVMSGTNQAKSPRIKELRTLALR